MALDFPVVPNIMEFLPPACFMSFLLIYWPIPTKISSGRIAVRKKVSSGEAVFCTSLVKTAPAS